MYCFNVDQQKKCLSATCVALQICWFQNIFNPNVGCSLLGELKHSIHRPLQLGLMICHNLMKWVLIAFPCHLLHSSGGLLPLVWHLEHSVWCVLSFIQGLPHRTLATPSPSTIPALSSLFLPSGGQGRTLDSPETLDILPQGQVDVLFARVRLPLQHAAQRVCHAGPHAAGHALLWHLWLGVVSVCCQDLAL